MMPTWDDEDRIPIDDDDDEIGGPWDPMAQYDLDGPEEDYEGEFEETWEDEEDYEEEEVYEEDC